MCFNQLSQLRLSIWAPLRSAKVRVNWTSGRRECVPCPGASGSLDSRAFAEILNGGVAPDSRGFFSVKWMDNYLIWDGQIWDDLSGHGFISEKSLSIYLKMTSSWMNSCLYILRPSFGVDVFSYKGRVTNRPSLWPPGQVVARQLADARCMQGMKLQVKSNSPSMKVNMTTLRSMSNINNHWEIIINQGSGFLWVIALRREGVFHKDTSTTRRRKKIRGSFCRVHDGWREKGDERCVWLKMMKAMRNPKFQVLAGRHIHTKHHAHLLRPTI